MLFWKLRGVDGNAEAAGRIRLSPNIMGGFAAVYDR
jgi:hypothetical protein